MMREISLGMACVDYIPVLLFASGAVILMRSLSFGMDKLSFSLFSAGMIDTISAGFLKATYKLLFAFSICDFRLLESIFFPLQSLGFLFSGLGMLNFVFKKTARKLQSAKKKHTSVYMASAVAAVVVILFLALSRNESKAPAPPLFSGTAVFVTIMILGLAAMDAGLCVTAYKLGMKNVIILLVLSFILSLFMGYLSSGNFEKSSMNWAAEAVNTVNQGVFLLAAVLLSRGGLVE